MSIAGMNASMGTPFFHEFKKQASFYFKEKIRTARLALTDVTPAQLMAEEAISGSSIVPDAKTMSIISRAAFEVDDYWRIVEILHRSFEKFDRKYWREPYKALVLLEHLLTHGPESTAEEFQIDRQIIEQMVSFQYTDERGFNWGLNVRLKAERILSLLERGQLLKDERSRARKISRVIQGFGSFNLNWSSTRNNTEEVSNQYGRNNSCHEAWARQRDEEDLKADSFHDLETLKIAPTETKVSTESSIQDNKNLFVTEEDGASPVNELKPLLSVAEGREVADFVMEDHPFSNFEHHSRDSMLLLLGQS